MSPILVRPIREQLAHDRVIRLLETRWRRRYEVGVNVTGKPASPLRFGARCLFPDLVMKTTDRVRGIRRLHRVVEVETNEAVNELEAMAQWAPFARIRAPFHLYVPPIAAEATLRLCEKNRIAFDEIWIYRMVGSEVRFELTHRAKQSRAREGRSAASPKVKAKTKAAASRKVAAGRKAAVRASGAKTKAKKVKAERKATRSKRARSVARRTGAGPVTGRAKGRTGRTTTGKSLTKRKTR